MASGSEVPRSRDRFGIVLILLIATILTFSLIGEEGWGRSLALVLEAVTLLFILHTAEANVRTRSIVSGLVIVALVGGLAAVVWDAEGVRWAPTAIAALLALVAPAAIVRRLGRTTRVTGQTVSAALCLYLLAGLFFAFLYGTLGAIGDTPFFVQEARPESSDYVYFSFVTLATVGYGDLTAHTEFGRMLAISEALLGQLYLVSVVALLVSNMGRETRLRRPAVADEEEP